MHPTHSESQPQILKPETQNLNAKSGVPAAVEVPGDLGAGEEGLQVRPPSPLSVLRTFHGPGNPRVE